MVQNVVAIRYKNFLFIFIFQAYMKLKTFWSYFLSFGQGLKLMVQKVFDDNNSNRNSLKFPFSLWRNGGLMITSPKDFYTTKNDETFIFYEKLFNSIHESVIKRFLHFTHCKHWKIIRICVCTCVHLQIMQTSFNTQHYVNMQTSTICFEPWMNNFLC